MNNTIWGLVGLVVVVWATTAPAQGIRLEDCKGKYTFWDDKLEVAIYHHGSGVNKQKPILFPVRTPSGVAVTRAWPMEPAKQGGSLDHPHQQSVWFCHGDVIPEGLDLKSKVKGVDGVDFWSVAPNSGTIECTKAEAKGNTLMTRNQWVTADKVKVLDETRNITLHKLEGAYLFVFDITLHASVTPITFGDTKEGAMGVRISDLLRETAGGKGTLQNAEGKKTEKECWGQRSAWCDYSGEIDGKTVGLAVFDDPKNVPQVCWHARGYGLMAANPFGREKARFPGVKGQKELVRLAKGEQLQLRYGVLVHNGTTTTGNVADHYKRFVDLREKGTK